MSSWPMKFTARRAALAAALSLIAMTAGATTAHAEGWIQLGIFAPSPPPPPVVVVPAPPPPPVYGYVPSYPYAYPYPYPYYAVPTYGYGGASFVFGANGWGRHHWHGGNREDND